MVKFSKLLILNLGLIIIVFLSCQSRVPSEAHNVSTVEANNKVESVVIAKSKFKITSPSKNEQFTIGDQVTISVKITKTTVAFDSIAIMADNVRQGLIDLEAKSFTLETTGFNTGSLNITVRAYIGGKINSSKSIPIILKSDIEPENWS